MTPAGGDAIHWHDDAKAALEQLRPTRPRPQGDAAKTAIFAAARKAGRDVGSYAAGKEPPKLDAAQEARAAMRLSSEADAIDGLVARWVERDGIPFALDALARMRSTETEHVVRAIRSHVLASSADGRAEARNKAALLRKGADLPIRVQLAQAVADTSFAEEDAEALLAQGGDIPSAAHGLLEDVRDPSLVTRLAKAIGPYSVEPLLLVRDHGFGALPILLDIVDEVIGVAIALSVLECKASADALAKLVGDRKDAPIAKAFFERRPDLGLAALAPIVAAKGKLATYAEPTYKALLRKQGSSAAEAAPSELPACLVTPPWKAPKPKAKPKSKRPELVLAPIEVAARAHMTNDDRKKRLGTSKLAAMSDAEAFKVVTQRSVSVAPGYAVARFGDRGISADLAGVGDDARSLVGILPFIESPVIASACARDFGKKAMRPSALEYFDLYPETCALTIIPIALGTDKHRREHAADALRALAATHRAVVYTALDRYGPEARAAAEALLGEVQGELPAKIPPLPKWFSAASLPAPVLSNGKALPPAAVDVLGTMLMLSPLERPLPALRDVKAACNSRSLATFAWELFQTWLASGGPHKDQWALVALAHLGDDEVARKLAPLVRAWPGEGLFARAVVGLDVLGAIGSDVALMHLHAMAQKLKSRALQVSAQGKIEAIARARGLRAEQLADRLVPDLGLQGDGTMVLDFGPRRFQVTFDEGLVPRIVGGAELPKPTKSDDRKTAAAATETWTALKQDARTIASSQILRLERAMCSGRTWSASELLTFFVRHPLIVHLARRLVWRETRTGATFRVEQDGTFAGAGGAAFTLTDDGVVAITHRVDLGDDEAARWLRVLSDYQIVQPFEQVTRAVHRPTTKEAKAKALDRFAGRKVEATRVLGLEARGWTRGVAEDGGWVAQMTKTLPSGAEVELSLGDGFDVTSPASSELTLGSATLSEGTLGELPPVVFSEIVRDLSLLEP